MTNSAIPEEGPRNLKPKIFMALVLLAVCGTGARLWWRGHNFEETDNAYVTAHVSNISSRVTGVVTRVYVSDNQYVNKGDEIADLDDADQKLQVAKIEAQLSQIDSRIKQADAQLQLAASEQQMIAAQLIKGAAQQKRADLEASRFTSLFAEKSNAIAKSELDNALTARDSARAEVLAQNSQSKAADAKISAARYSIASLESEKKLLAAQLDDAKLQLGYHKLVSPVSGYVGKKNIEVGVRVQAGQQLVGLVQDGQWLVANFKETQISDLHIGQKATVQLDATPGKTVTGTIESIAPASGAQFALLPPDNATGNFTRIVQRVPVKIVFDEEDLKKLSTKITPGMSATVAVDLRQAAEPKAQAVSISEQQQVVK